VQRRSGGRAYSSSSIVLFARGRDIGLAFIRADGHGRERVSCSQLNAEHTPGSSRCAATDEELVLSEGMAAVLLPGSAGAAAAGGRGLACDLSGWVCR